MKQRYAIDYKGLGSGVHHFEFRADASLFDDYREMGVTDCGVDVVVELDKKGTVMRLDVAMRGSVTVPCDRCLEKCELPVEFNGKLAVKFSGEEHPFDGDTLWLHPGEGTIDLRQYIYESIVLSLPYRKVHPEDVHGTPLCNPAMLERFRIVSEEEFEELAAETAAAENDPRWQKLRAIREEQSKGR